MTHAYSVRALTALLLLSLIEPASGADPGPLPADGTAHRNAPASPFDIAALKTNWSERIEAIKATGTLPIIDIESSFNSEGLDIRQFAQSMDKAGIALVAYSHQDSDKNWSDATMRVVAVDPWRFIPVTNAGIHPAWTETPQEFLAATRKHVVADGYPLMGEFEFRHYPSPRQIKRQEMYRDVDIPINGPLGHGLFSFSEKTGIPFQIHYEIEDGLLPALEEMLRKYPKAKVIWCHLAQVRYSGRSTIYGPAYVRKLIEAYPNLYFDVAFGGPDSVYPGSGERHARVWDSGTGQVGKEWVDLMAAHPWRFLAALDLGGDRQDQLPEYSRNLRKFLNYLPEPTRQIVAYKAAWKLLFGEELRGT